MTMLTSVENPSEKVGKGAETLEAFPPPPLALFAFLTDGSLLSCFS